MSTRICKQCGKEKELTLFVKNKKCPLGYRLICKQCRSDNRDSQAKHYPPIKSLPNEIWKDIIGYEGLYEVSTLGRVKSLQKHHPTKPIKREKLLIPSLSRGYLHLTLCKDRKHNNRSVHRLVANAFIPNPKNKPEINHKNRDRADNSEGNLEWATAKENYDHWALPNWKDHYEENHPSAKLTKDDVLLIRASNRKSIELADDYNVSVAAISKIRLRQSWTWV